MQFELINVDKVYVTSEENKVYGARSVNLEIPSGEFMALVGPSGSGKTTILNLIAGLLLPTNGQLKHGGKDITSFSLEERTKHRLDYMGFVFQDYQLLPILTAAENIEFPLQLKGLEKAEIKERVNWALKQVGLENMGNRFPKQLSGGQQQRLALARAWAKEPELLFLDEPTASLDPPAKREIEALVQQMIAPDGQSTPMTLVFASHNLGQVKRWASRVIYLEQGRILADLPTADFFNSSPSRFRFVLE